MTRVLVIGNGAFGAVHLAAWAALGLGDRVTVADPDPAARARAVRALPSARVVADWHDALADADVVDILSPSDTHHAIAAAALDAGRDLFIEKPVTATAAEAADLLARARAGARVVQGGLYFRFHPKARALRRLVAEGRLGALRTLSGRFLGLKRARADSGALHNDAVHFIDLFCWLMDRAPTSVYAVARDHFGRGSEDAATVQLTFPGGAAALVETGYVQPGRWPDAVVPGAVTTKEIALSAEAGVAEIDFAREEARLQFGRHVPRGGLWVPDFAAVEVPDWPAADPVAVVTAELAHFLDCVARRAEPEAGLADCGLRLGRVIDACLLSARENRVVTLAPE